MEKYAEDNVKLQRIESTLRNMISIFKTTTILAAYLWVIGLWVASEFTVYIYFEFCNFPLKEVLFL